MMTPNDYPAHNGYAPFPTTIPPYVGAILFETFLYGIYFNLFLICVYVLLRRRQPLHYILLISAITMFALATADIVYTYCIVFRKLFNGGLSFPDLRPKYYLYVTNNVLADALLLYRCYIVWDFKKHIVVGPLILLIAGTVCGYIFEGSTTHLFKYAWVYLAMTLVLNLLLTGLTAGRIWWIARAAEPILGAGVIHRYNSTIAILTESGSIYSFYIVLTLAFQNHKTGGAILDSGLIQVVGIMPTLIIAQVGLGRAVHDLETRSERFTAGTVALDHDHDRDLEGTSALASPTKGSMMMMKAPSRSYPDGIHFARPRSSSATSLRCSRTRSHGSRMSKASTASRMSAAAPRGPLRTPERDPDIDMDRLSVGSDGLHQQYASSETFVLHIDSSECDPPTNVRPEEQLESEMATVRTSGSLSIYENEQ